MIKNLHLTSTSRWRRVVSSLLLLAAFVITVGAIAALRQPAIAATGGRTGSLQSNKIAPWVTEHTANGQQAEFFVVMADQADLSCGRELADESREGTVRVPNPFQ